MANFSSDILPSSSKPGGHADPLGVSTGGFLGLLDKRNKMHLDFGLKNTYIKFHQKILTLSVSNLVPKNIPSGFFGHGWIR
jgi:hypothetical protein